MQIILLDKIRNLGTIGEQVNVKRGYARNYLIPKNKAVLATEKNLIELESRRAELEKAALEALEIADKRAKNLANVDVTIPVKVSEEGRLFGSIGMREILIALRKFDEKLDKNEISLPEGPLKQLGEHEINLLLHSDVTLPIKIKVVAE
jgi:large subunit ribosomal protein L9